MELYFFFFRNMLFCQNTGAYCPELPKMLKRFRQLVQEGVYQVVTVNFRILRQGEVIGY